MRPAMLRALRPVALSVWVLAPCVVPACELFVGDLPPTGEPSAPTADGGPNGGKEPGSAGGGSAAMSDGGLSGSASGGTAVGGAGGSAAGDGGSDQGSGGTLGVADGGATSRGGASTGGEFGVGGSAGVGGAPGTGGSGSGGMGSGGVGSGGRGSGGIGSGGAGAGGVTGAGGAGAGGALGAGGLAGSGGTTACCDCDGDHVTAKSCGGTDCDDHDANVFPGQTLYFTTAAKNGTFDYDCSNTLDRDPAFNLAVDCASAILGLGCPTTQGFLGKTIPACGATAAWGACKAGTLNCVNDQHGTETVPCH